MTSLTFKIVYLSMYVIVIVYQRCLQKKWNRLFLWLLSLDKALLSCYSKQIISGGGTSGGGRLTGHNTMHSKRLFYTFLTNFLPQIPFQELVAGSCCS